MKLVINEEQFKRALLDLSYEDLKLMQSRFDWEEDPAKKYAELFFNQKIEVVKTADEEKYRAEIEKQREEMEKELKKEGIELKEKPQCSVHGEDLIHCRACLTDWHEKHKERKG